MQMLYFGESIALCGYATLYMLEKGFSNSVIGITLSLINILSIFVQSAVSSFCDRHKEIDIRHVVIVILGLVFLLSLSIGFVGAGSGMLLCIFVTLYTAHQTISPLINSMAFLFEKHGIRINFGLGRGMGSATYATVSLILGFVTEYYGVDILPLFYMTFCLLLIIVVRFYTIPAGQYGRQPGKGENTAEDGQDDSGQVRPALSFPAFMIRYKRFTIFCLGATMVYFTHIIITTYTIQIVQSIGGDESDMGLAVFIACIMELPAMALFEHFRVRWGCRKVMICSMCCFLLKHTLTMLVPSVAMLYGVQLLQFFGFGLFFPAAVYYGNQVVAEEDAVKAQALVQMSYTISAIYASLAGGLLLDWVGVKTLLLVGVGFSIAGLLVCMLYTDRDV